VCLQLALNLLRLLFIAARQLLQSTPQCSMTLSPAWPIAAAELGHRLSARSSAAAPFGSAGRSDAGVHDIAGCMLYVACCALQAAGFMLRDLCCMLHVDYCMLHAARFMMHGARCMLHVVCCV
jgi:hypothetical protein